MLVEKGADINAKNRKGKTPIDVAASSVQTYLMSVRGMYYYHLLIINLGELDTNFKKIAAWEILCTNFLIKFFQKLYHISVI